MGKRYAMFFVLSLALVGFFAASVVAKNVATDPMDHYRFLLKPKMKTVGAEEDFTISGQSAAPTSLGSTSDPGTSPGFQVGFSYYDLQQNATMGRQVDWRGGPQIHFGWTFGPTTSVGDSRTVAYRVWEPVSGTIQPSTTPCAVVNPNLQRAGFCNIDVRPPNAGSQEFAAGVFGAHVSPGTGEDFQTQVFWLQQRDQNDNWCDFSHTARIVDTLEDQFYALDNLIWPKLEYHINGTDTMTYAVSYGRGNNPGVDPIVFWRIAGRLGDTTSSSPTNGWQGILLDSSFSVTHDVVASRNSGKVAVIYTIPSEGEDEGSGERDVAYRESTDMGATFGPVINVTNYPADQDGYRAWLESTGLYDSNDNLHLVWPANTYDAASG
ncbi:hypothetical protein GF420_09590, partial [candidate division GN15 bacterium]|nr:hypothetical protein [candidate division GN15 bacterium]